MTRNMTTNVDPTAIADTKRERIASIIYNGLAEFEGTLWGPERNQQAVDISYRAADLILEESK